MAAFEVSVFPIIDRDGLTAYRAPGCAHADDDDLPAAMYEAGIQAAAWMAGRGKKPISFDVRVAITRGGGSK